MKKVFLHRPQWNNWVMHELLLEIAVHYRDTKGYEIVLHDEKSSFPIEFDGFKYNLPDCELVMYDSDNDILTAVSHSYRNLGLLEHFRKRNNKKDTLLLRNYYYWKMHIKRKDDWNFKLEPTIFYAFSNGVNYYNLRTKRKWLYPFEKQIDKMWFKALIFRNDEKRLSQLGYTNDWNGPKLKHGQYLNEAIKYKIGLSIPGTCELCHRDFEYMALGIPFLRFEFAAKDYYNPKLIANEHYISIDRDEKLKEFPADHLLDQKGDSKKDGDVYVQKYIDKFEEVKNDKEFLSYVANNAFQYWEDHCSPQNMLKSILNNLKNNNE